MSRFYFPQWRCLICQWNTCCNDAISINRSINLIIDYFNNRLLDFNRLIVAALPDTWTFRLPVSCVTGKFCECVIRGSTVWWYGTVNSDWMCDTWFNCVMIWDCEQWLNVWYLVQLVQVRRSCWPPSYSTGWWYETVKSDWMCDTWFNSCRYVVLAGRRPTVLCDDMGLWTVTEYVIPGSTRAGTSFLLAAVLQYCVMICDISVRRSMFRFNWTTKWQGFRMW